MWVLSTEFIILKLLIISIVHREHEPVSFSGNDGRSGLPWLRHQQHGLENLCFQALGINDVTRVDISKKKKFQNWEDSCSSNYNISEKKNKENIPND